METLFGICRHYFEKEEAFSTIKMPDGSTKETNAIYVSDLAEDANTFSMLLVRGDPARAFPSFVNPKKRTVTPITTDDPDEVPGASSHLVISKRATGVGHHKGRHRTAMERTRGITRSLARDFLTSLMGRYAEERPDEFVAEKVRRKKTEKPEHLQYRPTVAFHPQENGSLKRDLEEGRIGGFRLRRGTTEFQGEAHEAKVQSLDVQLTARIIPTSNIGQVKSLIDHLRQSLDNIDFEALNLELVDDHGQEINTRSIDVDKLDEGDMRYVKTIPLADLGEGLLDCYADFYPPILRACKSALTDAKNWE